MTSQASPPWRRATADDAVALRDLERAANLAALAHVFPAAEFPFPDDEVLRRWCATLVEPHVRTELCADPDLVALVSYDARRLRHVAVRPDRWGTGLARTAVERAARAIRAGGETPVLWCLVDNHRARGLYDHLGWRPTGNRQRAEWPPYPVEEEWTLPESAHGR